MLKYGLGLYKSGCTRKRLAPVASMTNTIQVTQWEKKGNTTKCKVAMAVLWKTGSRDAGHKVQEW